MYLARFPGDWTVSKWKPGTRAKSQGSEAKSKTVRGDNGPQYQVSSNGGIEEQTAKQKVQLLQRQLDLNSGGPQKSSIPKEVAILAARPLPTTRKDLARQPEGECDPESNIPCSCPRRQFTDPPDRLPFPLIKSNRKALEDYIKSHYKASAR